MKDDNDYKKRLTPLEYETYERAKRKHERMMTFRDMWYLMKVSEIYEECQAALSTAKEGEDEIDAQIREDMSVCESFMELVARAYEGGTDPSAPDYVTADPLSKNFVEIGIRAVMERFGHIIGPEGGFDPPSLPGGAQGI